jgi:hypothetical protein
MRIYKTKIGAAIVIPLFFILGGLAALMIYQQTWRGFFILTPLIAFIAYTLYNIRYMIKDDVLLITCRFLYTMKIPVSSIRKINETKNPLSSPAASLDRLELVYNNYDSVLVSPENKMDFIRELKEINPEIEITLKKRK